LTIEESKAFATRYRIGTESDGKVRDPDLALKGRFGIRTSLYFGHRTLTIEESKAQG